MKRAFIITVELTDTAIDITLLANQFLQACQTVIPDPDMTVAPWSQHGESSENPALLQPSTPFPTL